MKKSLRSCSYLNSCIQFHPGPSNDAINELVTKVSQMAYLMCLITALNSSMLKWWHLSGPFSKCVFDAIPNYKWCIPFHMNYHYLYTVRIKAYFKGSPLCEGICWAWWLGKCVCLFIYLDYPLHWFGSLFFGFIIVQK